MKKKLSFMLAVILILQIILPMLTIIWENALTLKSVAYDGTEYYINSAQDMWDFAEKVNNGDTFEGVTVYLNQNIDLGCNENKQWIPIGRYIESEKSGFNGVFDGQNHNITGLYINTEEAYQGLFGSNTGIIKNVNVVDGYIFAMSRSGGIVGYNDGGNENQALIYNCSYSGNINSGKVSGHTAHGSSLVGGIVGYNYRGTIEECTNYGTIKTFAGGSQFGGITGLNSGGEVKKCINMGSMEGKSGGGMGRNSR